MKRIFLEISSGQGPEECRLLTAKLARFLSGRLMAAGVSVCPVDLCGDWERDSLRSVLFEVGGKEAGAMTALLCGTVLWVSASPFRPHHKRRNWFAASAVRGRSGARVPARGCRGHGFALERAGRSACEHGGYAGSGAAPSDRAAHNGVRRAFAASEPAACACAARREARGAERRVAGRALKPRPGADTANLSAEIRLS